MSPRPYRLGQRQGASDETRAKIVAAARALIAAQHGFAGFTIEAVARRADVARMTVYYQFGSKVGLLEALCDDLAISGGMENMAAAFRKPDPREALAEYIRVLCHFFESDRLVTRRLRALAALDSDFAQVIQQRDERRRTGTQVLAARLAAQRGRLDPAPIEEAADVLYMLLSFETLDGLAGTQRSIDAIALLINRVALAVLVVELP